MGGEEHEEAELVSLALESQVGHVVGQSAEPRPRHQHLLAGSDCGRVEAFKLVQDGFVTGVALFLAILTPVTHKHLQCGLNLNIQKRDEATIYFQND